MKKTKKLTLSAVLVALALVLGLLEKQLPLALLLPLPGVKLGLSNIVTLFALYALGPAWASGILLIRILLGAIFGGSVTSLLYSLAGGLLAFLVMLLGKRGPHLSVYGVAVLGAAAHNLGQIAAAAAVMVSPAVFSYLPLLLLTSIGTGLLVGAAACAVLRALPSPAVSPK